MIAKRLVSTMNASSSDMGQVGPIGAKIKRKVKSMKSQRGMKQAIKKQEEGKLSKAPKASKDKKSDSEVHKYAQPVRYKMNQAKKEMQRKFQDTVSEMKQKSMERKNKRSGSAGEGGFEVCGPGGCKEGKYGKGRGI